MYSIESISFLVENALEKNNIKYTITIHVLKIFSEQLRIIKCRQYRITPGSSYITWCLGSILMHKRPMTKLHTIWLEWSAMYNASGKKLYKLILTIGSYHNRHVKFHTQNWKIGFAHLKLNVSNLNCFSWKCIEYLRKYSKCGEIYF